MKEIEPTLYEQEKLDEEKLVESLKKLNITFKRNDNVDFANKILDFYKDNLTTNKIDTNILTNTPSKRKNLYNNNLLNNENINYTNLKLSKFHNSDLKFINKQNSLETSDIKTDFASNISSPFISQNPCNSVLSENDQEFENIITKNIDFSDEILKFIVVGEKMVGKTTLINQLKQLNIPQEERVLEKAYLPTNNMNIQKSYLKLGSKNVKMELFDTNISINTSLIIQSNT